VLKLLIKAEPRSESLAVNTGATKMLAIQLLLVAGVAILFYVYQGALAAQAALYGGGIVMFNVWMMNRRIQAAIELAKVAPGQEVKVLYITAVQRFILTLVFLGFGMGGLQLPPIPLVVALAVAQLGYLFNGRFNSPKYC
jgi:ATP synthase protein I